MVEAALDLWTLFVQNVFGGSFAATVIGLTIVYFIILILGRISIYTAIWVCLLFILALSLGYGIVIFNIAITLCLLVALYFSVRNYFG